MATQLASPASPGFVETDIPARLDRLPWSRWHLRMVAALSVTWLLDGLEGSLGGSLAGALKGAGGLSLSDAQLGVSSSCYLAGAVIGALVFGFLADRFGRRKLFLWTLVLYLCATAATGLSWSLASFTCFRVLTGAGIGGEYAAINSAVDELIPARMRGRIDLLINGTFWLGIMLGSGVAVAFLSPAGLGPTMGWRAAFFSGVPIACVVLWMRRYVPESPRWSISHGDLRGAELAVLKMERAAGEARPRVAAMTRVRLERQSLLRLIRGDYRGRAVLCFLLMAAQAFFYNSVFFSLALVLLRYYGVAAERVGGYFVPIAVANFLGPVLLGGLFDRVGRRQMVGLTYGLSGLSLLASSWLFLEGRLSTGGQIGWWAATFFFASTAASSAYLTVSEVFPQEVRATAIAFFYAFGTLLGGVCGPLVFGRLVASRTPLFLGYLLGAAVMLAAGIAQAVWGVAAERRPLEELAPATGRDPARR